MQPRRLLLPLGLVCVALVALTALVLVVGRGGHARDDAEESTPREVLRAWDERRAAAWAGADVGALRALYVEDAAAGRRDVRMLRSYVARGLSVRGMSTQVLAFEVLEAGDDILEVRVTDRVVGAVAVRDDDETTLPVAAPQERRVTLQRQDGRWLVASVATLAE